MSNKHIHNHHKSLVSKWKKNSGSKHTMWVCNLLRFHHRYHDNQPFFSLTPHGMNSFNISKSHKENKNVSPECSTNSKQIKPTQNVFLVCLSVLTGRGPDSWVLKVWGCQSCFCLSLIITYTEEHVVYCLVPGLQCWRLRFLGETGSPSSKICPSALSEYFFF